MLIPRSRGPLKLHRGRRSDHSAGQPPVPSFGPHQVERRGHGQHHRADQHRRAGARRGRDGGQRHQRRGRCRAGRPSSSATARWPGTARRPAGAAVRRAPGWPRRAPRSRAGTRRSRPTGPASRPIPATVTPCSDAQREPGPRRTDPPGQQRDQRRAGRRRHPGRRPGRAHQRGRVARRRRAPRSGVPASASRRSTMPKPQNSSTAISAATTRDRRTSPSAPPIAAGTPADRGDQRDRRRGPAGPRSSAWRRATRRDQLTARSRPATGTVSADIAGPDRAERDEAAADQRAAARWTPRAPRRCGSARSRCPRPGRRPGRGRRTRPPAGRCPAPGRRPAAGSRRRTARPSAATEQHASETRLTSAGQQQHRPAADRVGQAAGGQFEDQHGDALCGRDRADLGEREAAFERQQHGAPGSAGRPGASAGRAGAGSGAGPAVTVRALMTAPRCGAPAPDTGRAGPGGHPGRLGSVSRRQRSITAVQFLEHRGQLPGASRRM